MLPSSRSVFRTSKSVWCPPSDSVASRSEEHTSELQSHSNLVCRLLLENKKQSETSCFLFILHVSHIRVDPSTDLSSLPAASAWSTLTRPLYTCGWSTLPLQKPIVIG